MVCRRTTTDLPKSATARSSNSSNSAVYEATASGANASIILNNTSIVASNRVQGAFATLGGSITLNGGSVTTDAALGNRVGLWATRGSTLTANNVDVRTEGNGGAHGVRADNPDSLVTVNGGTVSTIGSFAGGVTTEPPNGLSARDRSRMVSSETIVTTTGLGGIGVVSENSTINLSRNSVTTVGDFAAGGGDAAVSHHFRRVLSIRRRVR
jgi:autotransporter family porin